MLESKKVAMALAQTSAIAYAVCAAVVAAFPGFAWRLAGNLMHLVNMQQNARLTFGGFLSGFLQVIVYAYLVGWLFTVLYNRATRVR